MRIVGISATVIALFAAWMFFHGRYFVEGGRAPWAVINDRSDVLAEALQRGVSDAERASAMRHALSRKRHEAVTMLLASGLKPNPSRCELGVDVPLTLLMLDAGATTERCDQALLPNFIAHEADTVPEPTLLAVVARLVERGADVNAKDLNGRNALSVAKALKLRALAAWLEDPTQPLDEEAKSAPKPALRGGALKLARDDFKFVCDGEAQPNAPAYVREPGTVSPVLNFERRGDTLFWPGRKLPHWWSTADDVRHTQLVACVRVTAKTVVNQCHYEGRGGGITVFDADYEFIVREAISANEVARTSVSLTNARPRCDMFKSGTQQEGAYPDYSAALRTFIASLVVTPGP